MSRARPRGAGNAPGDRLPNRSGRALAAFGAEGKARDLRPRHRLLHGAGKERRTCPTPERPPPRAKFQQVRRESPSALMLLRTLRRSAPRPGPRHPHGGPRLDQPRAQTLIASARAASVDSSQAARIRLEISPLRLRCCQGSRLPRQPPVRTWRSSRRAASSFVLDRSARDEIEDEDLAHLPYPVETADTLIAWNLKECSN